MAGLPQQTLHWLPVHMYALITFHYSINAYYITLGTQSDEILPNEITSILS